MLLFAAFMIGFAIGGFITMLVVVRDDTGTGETSGVEEIVCTAAKPEKRDS